MKNNKIEIVSSILMISLLVLILLSSCFYSIFPKVLEKLDLTNDRINKFFKIEKTNDIIDVNYKKLYPFDDTEKILIKENIIDKYKQLINNIEEKIETYTSEKLMGYEKMVEFSYYYNDAIKFNLVSNNSDARINLGNGYYSILNKQVNTDQLSEKLIKFNNYLKDKNIEFMYIQAPFKISKEQKILSIYTDYTNENMDNLLKNIYNKVDYIDLRQNIVQENLNHLELFYKTDHHWLPQTGFWATNKISSYINDKYNLGLRTENITADLFNNIVYPNMFLGSDGRYVSLKKANPENFTVILPKYETSLSIKIPDLKIDTTGTYEETLLDKSQLKYGNFYKINQYATYSYGDRALIEIHNNLVNNGKKILLVKDSFSEVVIPFLALENEYLNVIDMRHFDGSLKTYINKYQPDFVIVMYNGGAIIDLNDLTISNNNKNMWNFD